MEDMKSRIERGDIKLERTDAIKVPSASRTLGLRGLTSGQAMCEIAADRANKALVGQ